MVTKSRSLRQGTIVVFNVVRRLQAFISFIVGSVQFKLCRAAYNGRKKIDSMVFYVSCRFVPCCLVIVLSNVLLGCLFFKYINILLWYISNFTSKLFPFVYNTYKTRIFERYFSYLDHINIGKRLLSTGGFSLTRPPSPTGDACPSGRAPLCILPYLLVRLLPSTSFVFFCFFLPSSATHPSPLRTQSGTCSEMLETPTTELFWRDAGGTATFVCGCSRVDLQSFYNMVVVSATQPLFSGIVCATRPLFQELFLQSPNFCNMVVVSATQPLFQELFLQRGRCFRNCFCNMIIVSAMRPLFLQLVCCFRN